MDEMNDLERQLASVVRGAMRPPRPVDAAAIVRSATSAVPGGRWSVASHFGGHVDLVPTTRGFTMSAAFKFVVAAAIVTLFGGLLLMGVLTAPQGDEVIPAAVTDSHTPETTTPSPPMNTEELLSSLAAEEIEPGILRVDSDGVRFLSSADNRDVVAGYDGGIWLLRDEGFLRVGSDVFQSWPADVDPDRPIGVLEVTPDGTYWALQSASKYLPDARWGSGLRSSDGEAWTTEPCPTEDCTGVTVAPDGVVWASWTDEGGAYRVGHLGAEGWEPLDGYVPADWSPGVFDRLFFTDAGDLYGVDCLWACALYHHEDGSWQRGRDAYMLVDVGPDGTIWQDGGISDEVMASFPGDGLARYRDGEWETWTSADLPEISVGLGLDQEFTVAPDGSLWFSLWRSTVGDDPRTSEYWRWEEREQAVEDGRVVCDGLARFDGETLARFLPGHCVSMDIAADGSAWVLADSEDEYMVDGTIQRILELHVITPAAVVAALADPAPSETPSPLPPGSTEGLLASMVTEEIEPGVFRVVNDGYRDVSHPDDGPSDAVIVGDVGEVWRITPPRRLFRLGYEAEWDYDPGLVQIDTDNTVATGDGRLWTVAAPIEYRIFEDGSWGPPTVEFGQHYETLATEADGTVWLLAEDTHLRLLRGGDDVDVAPSWRDVYEGDVDWTPPKLAVTDAGEAWLVDRGGSDNFHDFLRFDGEAWQVVPPPIDTAAGPQAYWAWDVGSDGTIWTVADALGIHDTLARLDEDGWTIFTAADGVEPWGQQPMGWWGTDIVRVAPDGSAWVNATDEEARTCDGLARFDGESWTPFLTGRCIADLDIAPDGSVWVVAWEPTSGAVATVDTFVITPDAMASQP